MTKAGHLKQHYQKCDTADLAGPSREENQDSWSEWKGLDLYRYPSLTSSKTPGSIDSCDINSISHWSKHYENLWQPSVIHKHIQLAKLFYACNLPLSVAGHPIQSFYELSICFAQVIDLTEKLLVVICWILWTNEGWHETIFGSKDCYFRPRWIAQLS